MDQNALLTGAETQIRKALARLTIPSTYSLVTFCRMIGEDTALGYHKAVCGDATTGNAIVSLGLVQLAARLLPRLAHENLVPVSRDPALRIRYIGLLRNPFGIPNQPGPDTA